MQTGWLTAGGSTSRSRPGAGRGRDFVGAEHGWDGLREVINNPNETTADHLSGKPSDGEFLPVNDVRGGAVACDAWG